MYACMYVHIRKYSDNGHTLLNSGGDGGGEGGGRSEQWREGGGEGGGRSEQWREGGGEGR